MTLITKVMQRVPYFLLSLLLAPSISSATTIITDPLGDAGSWADIVSIAGGYDANNLYLSASFAPGTLNPSNFSLTFYLDTDLNTATHSGQFQFFTGDTTFPGADYIVSYSSSYMNITYNSFPGGVIGSFGGIVDSMGGIQGPNGILTGTPFQTQFFPDEIMFSVPLNLLGNDDGIANFGAVVSGAGCQNLGFSSTPMMCWDPNAEDPDGDYATGHNRVFVGGPSIFIATYPLSGPTTPVPEPSPIALFAIGAMALIQALRRQNMRQVLH